MKKIYFTLITLLSLPVFGQIQQDVNKTNGTESNPITEIDSIRFNGSQTEMQIIFNNGSAVIHSIEDINNVTFSGEEPGDVDDLDCANATINGTLVEGTAASGVSADIDYTGGNGGPHTGQTVNSTGVTGLTADLPAGNFANGAGTLTYDITGTPNSSGTASFAIQIGGMSCTLEVTVDAATPTYPSGTVHCSGTPTAVVDVTNPITGETWMDRNLGAEQVADSSKHVEAYGDLYQWGRLADGHQCRNSSGTYTTAYSEQPTNDYFVVPQYSPYDWLYNQNNNLWQGVNGINNPCPSGYRVPTRWELDAELQSWSTNNAAGAFDSPLKFTMAGSRFYGNGSVGSVGTSGSYWSSTSSGSNSRYMYFNSSTSAINTGARAYGFSVRCIKD